MASPKIAALGTKAPSFRVVYLPPCASRLARRKDLSQTSSNASFSSPSTRYQPPALRRSLTSAISSSESAIESSQSRVDRPSAARLIGWTRARRGRV
jgi:hypothetical protein